MKYAYLTRDELKILALTRGEGSSSADDAFARLYIEVASANPLLKPVLHAKAFLLRRDGYTITEAAEILECSESTVERALRQFVKYSWKYILKPAQKTH